MPNNLNPAQLNMPLENYNCLHGCEMFTILLENNLLPKISRGIVLLSVEECGSF